MGRLRGVTVGAGYFGRFHHEAWSRIPVVEIAAVCDLDPRRAEAAQALCGAPRRYADFVAALDAEKPDFVDVITPPATHPAIVSAAAERGVAVVCQKPLADTYAEARQVVETCRRAGVRLMVHENFRFQPWHREIGRQLRLGALGTKLHALTFRSRPGDGWGPDAYLGRQPYFRSMPRFLIHETGVHFIDTFRYLAGDVARVHAVLRRLNPAIAGEDCGLLVLEFTSGAVGLWDANRYNEPNHGDFRYTFGEFLVEGEGGSLRLFPDGRLTLQPLGRPERAIDYPRSRLGFAGDCVHATQRHFVENLRNGAPFETEGEAYLETLAVVEAAYESARRGGPVRLIGPDPVP